MLRNGELDAAPACFAFTNARSEVVAFLPAFGEMYSYLFLKNPADSLHWKAYVEPFTALCWIGIGLFVVIVPPIIAATMSYGKC